MNVPETTTETVFVPNISCDHCKRTIEREVGELAGMQQVIVDVPARRVTLTYSVPADRSSVQAFLEEIGYPIEGSGR